MYSYTCTQDTWVLGIYIRGSKLFKYGLATNSCPSQMKSKDDWSLVGGRSSSRVLSSGDTDGFFLKDMKKVCTWQVRAPATRYFLVVCLFSVVLHPQVSKQDHFCGLLQLLLECLSDIRGLKKKKPKSYIYLLSPQNVREITQSVPGALFSPYCMWLSCSYTLKTYLGK